VCVCGRGGGGDKRQKGPARCVPKTEHATSVGAKNCVSPDQMTIVLELVQAGECTNAWMQPSLHAARQAPIG
jgi:hypothetical protein